MPDALSQAIDALNRDYLGRYPAEGARLLSSMSPADLGQLLQAQPPSSMILVWQQLPLDLAAEVLSHSGAAVNAKLLTRADPVKVARVLTRVPQAERDSLLALTGAARARELEALMQYPDDSAGALMDTRFPVLDPEMTARAALKRLARRGARPVSQMYFTAGEPHRLWQIGVQDLALNPARTPIGAIAHAAPAAVLPTTRLEEIMDTWDRQRLSELPVVDLHGELVGIIHQDALFEAVGEQTSADLLTMVGASKEERALSKVGFVVRKRLPWLQVNLLTAFLAASVVGLFESTIAQFTALAVLLPVVAGQAGNTGAQALAVTMRALALHEISISHWRKVAGKEMSAGLINGVAVALVTAIGVLFWSGSYGLALVIASAMIISMVAAGLAGVVIPITLSALGQDPAQSSSIVLTTVTDVTGFMTFLGIATAFSSML